MGRGSATTGYVPVIAGPWDAALAEAKTIGLRTPALEAKAKDYAERDRE